MNEKQREALKNCCDRFGVPFNEEHYFSPCFSGKGWVEGWIGGPEHRKIYVGVSPEGNVHS